MNTTEKIVFKHDNKQIIQQGNHFFTRVLEDGEFFESGDFNTLERAKANLSIVPTIEENNKIIAEFMGLSKNIHLYESPISGKYIENLKYHSSWNWLMEVVEKIEGLEDSEANKICYINITATYCEIGLKDSLIESESITKLDAVYNACVQFINWYNQQNE